MPDLSIPESRGGINRKDKTEHFLSMTVMQWTSLESP